MHTKLVRVPKRRVTSCWATPSTNARKEYTQMLSSRLRCLMLATPLVVAGCGPKITLESTLKDIGYSAFSPFRTDDYPGTIIVWMNNHDNWSTEYVVASHQESFSLPPGKSIDDYYRVQAVAVVDKLTHKFDFDASLGVEFVSFLINPKLAAEYAKTITISLLDDKKAYELTFVTAGDLRTLMNPSLKRELNALAETGELPNAYLVMAVLQVGGIEIELTLKDKFVADVGLEKIKEIAKLDAAVTFKSESTYVLKHHKPILIGYKALPIPRSVFATASDATGDPQQLDTLILSPEQVQVIKTK